MTIWPSYFEHSKAMRQEKKINAGVEQTQKRIKKQLKKDRKGKEPLMVEHDDTIHGKLPDPIITNIDAYFTPYLSHKIKSENEELRVMINNSNSPKIYYSTLNNKGIISSWESFVEVDKRTIRLDNRGITTLSIPEADLLQAENLYLTYNKLKEVPSDVLRMPNLKRIYLEGNCINDIPRELDGMVF